MAYSEHEVQKSDSDSLNRLSAASDSFIDWYSEMDRNQEQTSFKIDTPTTSSCSYIPNAWSTGSPRPTLKSPSTFQEYISPSRDTAVSFCEVTEIPQPSYCSVSSSIMTPSVNERYQKSSMQSNSNIIQPASYTPKSLPRNNLDVLSDACDLILNSQNLQSVCNFNNQVNPVNMGENWILTSGENYPSPVPTPPVCVGSAATKLRQQSLSMKPRQAELDYFNMNLDSAEIGVLQYQGSESVVSDENLINAKVATGKVMSDAQISGQFSTTFHLGNEFRKR
ncbi:hypothetical protein BKA69DRAFT_1084773 [Paraphysoderma sedebokerense]|nr:hypothetical protein BKA69DRAFT_1084773 [Paraphysoderma sedebokerense]